MILYSWCPADDEIIKAVLLYSEMIQQLADVFADSFIFVHL